MRILERAIDELAAQATGAQQHHLGLSDRDGELQEFVASAGDLGSQPRHLGREGWILKHRDRKPMLHSIARRAVLTVGRTWAGASARVPPIGSDLARAGHGTLTRAASCNSSNSPSSVAPLRPAQNHMSARLRIGDHCINPLDVIEHRRASFSSYMFNG